MNQNVKPASVKGERPFFWLNHAAIVRPVNLATNRLSRPHSIRAYGLSNPKPPLPCAKTVSIKRRVRVKNASQRAGFCVFWFLRWGVSKTKPRFSSKTC